MMLRLGISGLVVLLLGACAVLAPAPAPERSEIIYAGTLRNELISFNAGRPAAILTRVAISGMQIGRAHV